MRWAMEKTRAGVFFVFACSLLTACTRGEQQSGKIVEAPASDMRDRGIRGFEGSAEDLPSYEFKGSAELSGTCDDKDCYVYLKIENASDRSICIAGASLQMVYSVVDFSDAEGHIEPHLSALADLQTTSVYDPTYVVPPHQDRDLPFTGVAETYAFKVGTSLDYRYIVMATDCGDLIALTNAGFTDIPTQIFKQIEGEISFKTK